MGPSCSRRLNGGRIQYQGRRPQVAELPARVRSALRDWLPRPHGKPDKTRVPRDTVTGLVEEWLRFEHTIDELYDVAVLPGVRQAEAIGLIGPEIEHVVSVEP